MAGTRTRGQDDQAIIDLAFAQDGDRNRIRPYSFACARRRCHRSRWLAADGGHGEQAASADRTKPPRSSAVLRGPNATPPFEYGASVATVQALDGDTL